MILRNFVAIPSTDVCRKHDKEAAVSVAILRCQPPHLGEREYKALDHLWWFRHILVMLGNLLKPVSWIGSSYKDFRAFPDPVQDAMGYALHRAQGGAMHESAKPLKGFGGAGVVEADHKDRLGKGMRA